MSYKKSLLSLTIFIMLVGCTNSSQSNNSDVDKTISVKETTEQKAVAVDSNVIKVYVDRAGQITANEKPISLKNLDSSFSNLKTINGIVYYSRDNSQEEPPEESMKVMELITRYSLPVKFYTDKTFTQAAN